MEVSTTRQQRRFMLCWGLLVVLSLGISQILQICGLKPTPKSISEVREVDGEITRKAYVFTSLEAYDTHSLEIIGVISVLIAIEQWRYAQSPPVIVASLARFTFISAGTVGFHWLFSVIARNSSFRPSGHMLYYLSCSYLHFHNGRCLVTHLHWGQVAWLLLLNVPYMMYCAVWTILVYHTAIEVITGSVTAVALTWLASRLRLDRE